MHVQDRIDIQRKQLKAGNPVLELVGPCIPGNGIIVLTAEQKKIYHDSYAELDGKFTVVHFIPASGSGSRMFDALFSFAANSGPGNATLSFVNAFIKNIREFAFFERLSPELQQQVKTGTVNEHALIDFILSESGLNFSNLPKGLIPFHRYDDQIRDAFQAHVLHGLQLYKYAGFHFTINRKFESEVRQSLQEQKKITEFSFAFSEQDKNTDAFAFDENYDPVTDRTGNYVTRPAGHGALLKNLDGVEADLIFIRNIDNIQHQNQCNVSVETRKTLGGILIELRAAIIKILIELNSGKIDLQKIERLNDEFALRIPSDKMNDRNFMIDLLNRPVRICGMVKNEGQPGGGPFWVKDEHGLVRRQIIEKSQIANNPEQLRMLDKATHFNPVEIVCSTKNFQGKKFDLMQFRNDSQYFIVQKAEKGKPIQYIEEPGLWNGSMDKWTTVFVEIDSRCFSPVKTVLDLLNPLHQGR
jgi:hypothetical protein